VRWYFRLLMLGLLAAGYTAPAMAQGLGKADILKASGAATCGDHGTSIHFEKTPKDAAKKAQKEEKLVFVVHISGLFEDPDLT
jgi:hypothetical protein